MGFMCTQEIGRQLVVAMHPLSVIVFAVVVITNSQVIILAISKHMAQCYTAS